MMAFVADGQLKDELLQQRDEYYKVSSLEKKKQRADIPEPKIDSGADAWTKSGKAVQLTTTEKKVKLSN